MVIVDDIKSYVDIVIIYGGMVVEYSLNTNDKYYQVVSDCC